MYGKKRITLGQDGSINTKGGKSNQKIGFFEDNLLGSYRVYTVRKREIGLAKTKVEIKHLIHKEACRISDDTTNGSFYGSSHLVLDDKGNFINDFREVKNGSYN